MTATVNPTRHIYGLINQIRGGQRDLLERVQFLEERVYELRSRVEHLEGDPQ